MDRQPLPFLVVEASGLYQQVTDGCASDDPVAAKPAAAQRRLGCQDEEAISVRAKMLDDDGSTLLAGIVAFV